MSVAWDEESARGDDQVAVVALKQYGFSDQLQSRMINLSENATYLVDDPGTGRNGILRVHREDYHPPQSIHSELAWLTALREQSEVSTPVVIPAPNGRRVVTATVNGVQRYAVLFEVVSGLEPDEIALDLRSLETLCRLTPLMHPHHKTRKGPDCLTRFTGAVHDTLVVSPRRDGRQDGIR